LVSRDMARMSFLGFIDIADGRVSAERAGLDSFGCIRLELVILVGMSMASMVSRLTSPNPAMMRRGPSRKRYFSSSNPENSCSIDLASTRPEPTSFAVSEPFFLLERGRYRDATHIVEMRSC
jgi:hypothetical protein